jgi:Ca2+/H+ antiporter
MSLRSWQVVILLAATLTVGLMADVFGVDAHTIMRGLRTTDDRTFVGASRPSAAPAHPPTPWATP